VDRIGYVVPSHDGPRTRDWFEDAVKRAGIQNLPWHDLRHAFASRLVMAGVPLRTLQVLMGHKSIETTLRYAHLAEPHLRDAVERLVKQTDTRTSTEQKSASRAHRAKISVNVLE
jgi:integrase